MVTEEWQGVRRSIAAHLAGKKGQMTREYIDEDGAIQIEVLDREEASFQVIESTTRIDPGTLTRSPKGLLSHIAPLNWSVTFSSSRTHHDPVFILKDGKEKKDGTRSLAGDLLYAEKEVTHLLIAAVDNRYRVGFIAQWHDNGFGNAMVQDPIGIPRENYVDYWKAKEGPRPVADYNDGSSRVEHRFLFTKMGDFETWIDDWIKIIAPESYVEPKPKAVKKTKDEQLLDGTEWAG